MLCYAIEYQNKAISQNVNNYKQEKLYNAGNDNVELLQKVHSLLYMYMNLERPSAG